MLEPREIAHRLAQRWNAGEHWPERHAIEGKAAFRESIDEWLSVWGSVQIETDHIEVYGEHPGWEDRGVDWFADHEGAVAAARGA